MKKKDPEKPGRCLYDWKDGSAYLLACRVCASGHTTVRMPSLGHDILDELFERGMLTGAALLDSQKPRCTEMYKSENLHENVQVEGEGER